MQPGKIYRQSQLLITQARCTTTILERMRGLLGRPMLKADEALVIDPCNSVHTFGMGYSLDIVFVNAQGLVIKLCSNLPKFRIAQSLGARLTIELAAGEIERLGLALGDQLQWRPD